MIDLLTATLILAAALAVFLTGCSHHIEGNPVEEPQTIHCDLIFPPAPPNRA